MKIYTLSCPITNNIKFICFKFIVIHKIRKDGSKMQNCLRLQMEIHLKNK